MSEHKRGCPLFTHPTQRGPDHPTDCTCPAWAEQFTVSYDAEEGWLVATDAEGASAIIADNVDSRFVHLLIPLTPAATEDVR